jgi:uracil permease
MAASSRTSSVSGYLPNDMPPPGQLILLGFQHVLTMFPATVFVALVVGFHVSTVLFVTGLATIVALILSRWQIGKFIPLYYGSSFSYIAAIVAVTNAQFGVVASDELISAAQGGIIVTGLLNVAVGAIIRYSGGKKMIDRFLPPVVTGSVAAVIGFALGFAALGMASGTSFGVTGGSSSWWAVALITLVSTIAYSVYLQGRGFIGMLPVLLGAITGYIAAALIGALDPSVTPNYAAFTALPADQAFRMPHFTFPSFSGPLAATAIFGIAVMAIATIPESTAHLYQISLYVDHMAEEIGREKLHLDQHVGFNLVLDGIGDVINGLLGSTAGTNYGENNSLMVITRNYSGPALIAAGAISMILAFSGHLSGLVNSVPGAVSGGLAIYLFGVIGMQGIALMMAEKVNLFDPKQLAIGATILVVGVGGHIGYNGFLPIPLLQGIFPQGWPAIATGAVAGILLNLLFTLVAPPEVSASPTRAAASTPAASVPAASSASTTSTAKASSPGKGSATRKTNSGTKKKR